MSLYGHLQERRPDEKPVTISTLAKMRADGEPIACITAYDASFANLVDIAGVDVALVGDSLGMVIQGHDTTVPVSVDAMVYHTRCVSRGLQRPLLIADMPFASYALPEMAFSNAARLMQEGGAQMVKLEGGMVQVRTVEFLSARDIPVCAHIGLTPQSVHKLGGFKVQGREAGAAERMIGEAKALEEAGADIVLLECVPSEVGAAVRAAVDVPVIGIGAGPGVDGQILVLYDIIGLTSGRRPRFVRDYSVETHNPLEAVQAYVASVKDGSYPAPEHCFS
jgi:3-methyl-2-oxobutanoate hydroxymethyltransferase